MTKKGGCNMTIEQQIEQNIPIDLKPKPKFRTSKNNYNYIRNNEVEYEWKLKEERDNGLCIG